MVLHPLWIVLMLLIGVVILGPIVVIVAVVLSATRRSSGRPANALVSPDGKWWWDGRQWQPMPVSPPSPSAPDST